MDEVKIWLPSLTKYVSMIVFHLIFFFFLYRKTTEYLSKTPATVQVKIAIAPVCVRYTSLFLPPESRVHREVSQGFNSFQAYKVNITCTQCVILGRGIVAAIVFTTEFASVLYYILFAYMYVVHMHSL